MRIGIGSYTFAWHAGVPGYPVPRAWTPDDLLDAAIELGAGVVQYCENLPLERLSRTALDALLARAGAADVAVEVGTRGLDADRLRRCAEIACDAGSPFVRLVIDSGVGEPAPGEVVEVLGATLARGWPAGVQVAIENHDRFGAATFAEIVRALGTERAGICLDTANSLGSLEGPAYVTETLAPYVLSLHLKDVRVRRVSHNMGFTVTGTPLGQGQLDVPGVLARLEAAGRRPHAIVELWPSPVREGTPPLDLEWVMARDSLAYLRTLLHGARA